MRWQTKKKHISPISASVEIALLTQAHSKQSENPRVLRQLVQALVFENKTETAIQLCEQSLHNNQQAYSLLAALLKQRGETDKLIAVSRSALQAGSALESLLYLAYAYAQKKRGNEAKKLIHHYQEQRTHAPPIEHLRLLFSTLLQLKQCEQLIDTYHSLSPSLQFDSALKRDYLRAQYQLGHVQEAQQQLNYQTMVKTYLLSELDNKIDTTTLNLQLCSFISNHPKLQYEPGNHTTRHGQRLHFETHWHPSLLLLEQQIKNAVQRFLNEHFFYLGSNKNEVFTLHLWATILEQHGYQTPHIHPEGIVSGVYYLQVPTQEKTNSASSTSGCLLFKQTETKQSQIIHPHEGLMVLFPSYFYHQTIPLHSNENRISIAFDVVRAINNQ